MLPYVNIHTHRPTGCGIELRTAGVHPWEAAKGLDEALAAIGLLREQLAAEQQGSNGKRDGQTHRGNADREGGASFDNSAQNNGASRGNAAREGGESAGGGASERIGSDGTVQALGEIGLDFACTADRNTQLSLLRAQLLLARHEGLPVVLHCVRAFEPLMRELDACKPRAVIFHGFVGSPEQARQALRRGYYLSFGERTFASPKTLRALHETPLSQLFFETDDAETTIGEIYARAAEVLGMSVEVLQRATLENYKRLFETQNG